MERTTVSPRGFCRGLTDAAGFEPSKDTIVPRILVIEDEPTIAMGLEDDLRMEGHSVEIATDGVAGESAARSGRHDLVLLDLMLPARDG
jgi:CheY-like chemotaxis protein